jgi:AAA15 family ATPase/GTPase
LTSIARGTWVFPICDSILTKQTNLVNSSQNQFNKIMLDSITIRNFKASGGKDLTLNNLSRVNYIVGKNGSGKTLLLKEITDSNLNSKVGLKNKEVFDLNDFVIEDENGIKTTLLKVNVNGSITHTGWSYTLQDDSTLGEFKIFINYKNGSPQENEVNIIAGRENGVNVLIVDQNGTMINQSNQPYIKNGFIDVHLIPKLKLTLDKRHDQNCKYNVNSDKPEKYLQEIINKENKFASFKNTKIVDRLIEFMKNSIFDKSDKLIFDFNPSYDGELEIRYESKISGIKDKMNFNDISDGQKSLINFFFHFEKVILDFFEPKMQSLSKLQDKHEKTWLIITIEEPETYFHPDFQKKLVPIFEDLVQKYKQYQLQFFISTHSPFIISAAAELPDQKVYLIEDGQCLNPEGSSKGGLKKQAIEMLGAGLDDFIPKTIIICEGEIRLGWEDSSNYQHDAKIYSFLFEDIEDVAFYSSGSKSDMENVAAHLAGLFSKISKSINYIVFCDSDYLNTGKNKTSLNKKYPNPYTKKTTNEFNNLESILYHRVITEKLGIPEFTEEMQKVDKHADNYFENNYENIKNLHVDLVDETKRKHWKSIFELKVLTPLIKEMGNENKSTNNIYWQLYNCIFA